MTSLPLSDKHGATTYRFDWVAGVLAGLVVFCAAASIATAEWMASLDLLALTTLAGWGLSSLIITRSWRARTVHCLMILYGIVWVMMIALNNLPDKVYGFTSLDSLRHLIVRLGEHVYLWLEAVSTGGVGKDNTIFLMLLIAGFWLITYLATWNTIRQPHLWRTVAPAGIILLINMYYYGGQAPLAFWLLVYLFGVLLYAARLYTLRQEQRWQFGRVRFKPDVERDFLQLGAIIAVAAVVFGMVAPVFAGAPQVTGLWREISRPIRSIEDTFSRLFSGLQPHGLPYTNPFGRTLALLGQRTLGNELVLEVRSPESLYWQGVVYDRYTGAAFQSSDTERISASIDERALPQRFDERELITQTVSVYFPNNTLIFAASQPVAVNQTSWLEMLPGNDLTMWTMLTPIGGGNSYRVVSAVSRALVPQLQAAGSTYPPTVRERYLQLPDTLPARVRDLAQQIVTDAKATNPYDQAAALETWLRRHIEYNDQIPAPSQGQDGVDYVLFETRQGFCDYYASAMAVMARSLGIPARIVTGFATGTYDSRRGVYQVYQNNAHTWVEIYFPSYGWVQFEPTASQPSIERPQPENTTEDSDSGDVGAGSARRRGREGIDEEFDPNTGPASDLGSPENPAAVQAASVSPIGWLLAIGLGAILLVAGGGFVAMGWYENRGAPAQAGGGTWAFARLSRMTRWLRVRQSEADTPYEQAKTIGAVVPKRQGEIDQLADLYVRERYGRAEVDPHQTRSIWQRLHWSLWGTGLKRRLPRWLSVPRDWLSRFKR
ncbi:Protein-glutamine gamma-glutamyltransferase [Thermoflexales bacterium]|nr:Protein-glutamine gamma-glutamyltransferase [Thermoflexales bacterium]